MTSEHISGCGCVFNTRLRSLPVSILKGCCQVINVLPLLIVIMLQRHIALSEM